MLKSTPESAPRSIPDSARFLRLPDVMSVTGLKRSTLLDCVKAGEFPRAVPLSRRCVAWVRADVDKWVDGRIAAGLDTSLGYARESYD